MKFLKTFLFAISFCFTFGSILSLNGFCQAVPELVPDSNGFSVIEGSGLQYYDWSMPITEMYFMQNPFVIDDMYYSMDSWLKNNTGYDIEHSYQMGIDGTVFTDGGAFDVATANWLADRFSRGTLTAAQIASNGYRIFSHSAQQWGSNAKEWFLGKIDSVTGKITNVTSNVVTKVTAEGLANYQSMLNSQLDNGTLSDLSSGNAFVSNSFVMTYKSYSSIEGGRIYTANFQFNDDLVFYTVDRSGYNTKTLYVLVPTSNVDFSGTYPKLLGSGVFVMSNSPSSIAYYVLSDVHNVTINNVSYTYGNLIACNSNGGWVASIDNRIPFGDYNQAITLLGGNASIANGFQLSPTVQTTLDDLLSQLIGKYVDNNILKDINDVIQRAPVVIETVDNQAIPVAEPSSSQIDEIEQLIQQAIDNSLLYEPLLSPYEEPEPEPDPEPSNVDYGLTIPDDFPVDTVAPVLDTLYLPSSFFSIFEPLFPVFGQHQTLMLNSWYIIPGFLIVLALFGLVL